MAANLSVLLTTVFSEEFSDKKSFKDVIICTLSDMCKVAVSDALTFITERFNGVNRQPSNGQKFNRQPSKKVNFYRQPPKKHL